MMDFKDIQQLSDLMLCGFGRCKSIEERTGARKVIGAILVDFRRYSSFGSVEEKIILDSMAKGGYFNAD